MIKNIEKYAEIYGNPSEVEVKLGLPFKSIMARKDYMRAFQKGLKKYLEKHSVEIKDEQTVKNNY